MHRRWALVIWMATAGACSHDAHVPEDASASDGAVSEDASAVVDLATKDASETSDAATGASSNAFGDTFVQVWTDDFTKDSSLDPALWEAADGLTPNFGSNGIDFSLPDGGERKGYIGSPPTLFGRYVARIYNRPLTTDQAGYLVRLNATQLHWDGNAMNENPPFEDWNEIDLETFNGSYITTGSLVPTYNLHFGDWTPQSLYNDNAAAQNGLVPEGWHVWTIDWTPNYIAWYVDSQVRHVMYNRSWKPGWTPLSGASDTGRTGDGSGMEAQLYPMSWCFSSHTSGALTSADQMFVSSATYSSLVMQSFAAQGYTTLSGGSTGTDSKGSPYVGALGPGDFVEYDGIAPQWRNIAMKIDASASGRQIQIRSGSPTGPVLATIDVPVTHGPEWNYDDLVVQTNTAQVASVARPFGQQGTDVGKTLTIAAGTGWTAGTYTISAVSSTHVATLCAGPLNSQQQCAQLASTGTAGASAGKASLGWLDPTHYTLVSANLSGSPAQTYNVFLTFVGATGGVNIHDLYFFGTAPSSNQ